MNDVNTIIKKKKWYKRKWVYIVAIIVLLIVGTVYGQIKKANQPPQYETVKVERGNLKQTVDATGNVESSNQLDMRFETTGKIAKVYKKVNDQVKVKDVIIEQDLSFLNASVAQASASVAQAKANLDKQIAGATPEYLAGMQASLDQAKANLAQVQASSDSSVNTADAALKTAENNLKLSTGGENSQIIQDAYDDMVAVLQSVPNTLSTALNQADNILGIDNTTANDSFEAVLSALDSSVLASAKNIYAVAKTAKVNAENIVIQINNSSTHVQIDASAILSETALQQTNELLFAVSAVLDKTNAIGSLTQTQLDTLKTNIQTVRTAVSTKYSSLVSEAHAVETAKNSLTTYQIAYQKALKDLTDVKNKQVADLASAQASVDKAQAGFNDANNPPREVDLASYRAALAQSQASLGQAVANRDKARIIAPLDAVIGKINFKVGEYVSPQDVVVSLVNPHYEVKIDIPETDIIKVAVGNPAVIKLDAYGDDIKFTGTVAQIEKGETVIQDVVYYKVTVTLEDDGTHQILNGMTANVTFATEQKDNVLFIPQRAVRTNSGKYVKVLENNQIKDVEIKLGLKGDGGMVEVIEGLNEGQLVVIGTVTK